MMIPSFFHVSTVSVSACHRLL